MDNLYLNLITSNLSYRDKQKVMNVVHESVLNKDKVIINIGKFFYTLINKFKIMPMLHKYLECNGDIKKLEGYKNCLECIKDLKHDKYADVAAGANTIEAAILNLQSRKKYFELACKTDSAKFSKLLFAVAVKMIVGGTSTLICHSATVDPDEGGKRKLVSSFPITCLSKFNEECAKGTVEKLLRTELGLEGEAAKEAFAELLNCKQLETVQEAGFAENLARAKFAIAAGAAAIAFSSVMVTLIRKAAYWVYYTRIDLADYFEHQAAYLELNKIALENRKDLSDDKRAKLIAKQEKWRERLLKLSDAIQLDDIKAERQAQDKSVKDEKSMKPSDLVGVDDTPDFF